MSYDEAFEMWMEMADKHGFLSDEAQDAYHVWKKLSDKQVSDLLSDLPF